MKLAELYEDYKTYASERLQYPVAMKSFSKLLTVLAAFHHKTSFCAVRNNRGVILRGFKLESPVAKFTRPSSQNAVPMALGKIDASR